MRYRKHTVVLLLVTLLRVSATNPPSPSTAKWSPGSTEPMCSDVIVSSLMPLPWCWQIYSEMDGDTAWRTCRSQILPISRARDFTLTRGPEAMWINAREAFPGADIYITTEPSVFPPKGKGNFTLMANLPEASDFQENCLAINQTSHQIIRAPCRGVLLPTFCAEGPQLLHLRAPSPGATQCSGSKFSADDGQLVVAETPFRGCFRLREAHETCPGAVRILVLLRNTHSCLLGVWEEHEAWYNGLLSTPEMWEEWERKSNRTLDIPQRVCTLCSSDVGNSTSMPLQLILRNNFSLHSIADEWALQEPFCTFDGNFIGNVSKVKELDPEEPRIEWCFQRSLKGNFVTSNRIIGMPNSYSLWQYGNESHPEESKWKRWELRGGKVVVARRKTELGSTDWRDYKNHDRSPKPKEMDINAGCKKIKVDIAYGVHEEVRLRPSSACLRRLCLAASGCRKNGTCSDENCGPFALSFRQWNRLRPFGDEMAAAVENAKHSAVWNHWIQFRLTEREVFHTCAKNMACAAEAAWALSTPRSNSDGDDRVDCDGRALAFATSYSEDTDYWRSPFFARYWRVSHDDAGEVAEVYSGRPQIKTSCVHALLYGRQWVNNSVEDNEIELINFGRFGDVFIDRSSRLEVNRPCECDNVFRDRFHTSVHDLFPDASNSTFASIYDDPLAGRRVDDVRPEVEETSEEQVEVTNPELSSVRKEQLRNDVEDELKEIAQNIGKDSESDKKSVEKTMESLDILLADEGKGRNGARQLEVLSMFLDKILSRVKLPPSNSIEEVKPQLAMGVAAVHKFGGFSLQCSGSCSGDDVETPFDANTKLNSVARQASGLSNQNMEAGALLPTDMSLPEGARITYGVFSSGRMFDLRKDGSSALEGTAEEEVWHLRSRVVEFSLWSDGGNKLQLPRGGHVDIMLRSHATSVSSQAKRCVFWNNRTRSWSGNGCQLQPQSRNGLDTCRCTHLSHFALLVSPSMTGAQSKALEIISVVGCVLSLFGIVGVFMTAFIVPSWRKKTENKVLLNQTTAVALTMLLFLITALHSIEPTSSACRIYGALLHYTVLASFLWSLTAAFVHYRRFTTLTGSLTSRLTLKAGSVSWGLPLLMVVLLASISPSSYTREAQSRGFCYPSGIAFYITVLTPIVIVVVINLVIFILVMRALALIPCWMTPFQKLAAEARRSSGAERRIFLRKVLVCVGFVFLFGLTWILGIFSASIVCAYLFCLTATLQGVVLYVFFAMGRRVRQRLATHLRVPDWGSSFRGRFRPVTRTTVTNDTLHDVTLPSSTQSTDCLDSVGKRSQSLPELSAAPHPRESHL